MIAPTLTEAVSQILGKKVTDGEAMHFAYNNYLQLRMFTRVEDKIVFEKKQQKRIRNSRRNQLNKRYPKPKSNGLNSTN